MSASSVLPVAALRPRAAVWRLEVLRPAVLRLAVLRLAVPRPEAARVDADGVDFAADRADFEAAPVDFAAVLRAFAAALSPLFFAAPPLRFVVLRAAVLRLVAELPPLAAADLLLLDVEPDDRELDPEPAFDPPPLRARAIPYLLCRRRRSSCLPAGVPGQPGSETP